MFNNFLENLKDAPYMFTENVSSLFTFDSLHTLHPGISEVFKICFVRFVGSSTLGIENGGRAKGSKPFVIL